MTKILVTGANGRTGQIVIQRLTEAGRPVRGVYRREGEAPDGAEAIVADLENDPPDAWLDGAEAVIFAAAGTRGRMQAVDHLAVRRLAQSAAIAGVRRFVLLSALGAHDPNSWGPAYAEYLGAKANGETAVRNQDLDWTIVRPGSLGDGRGSGRIEARTRFGASGSIARADLAETLVATLDMPATVGVTFEVVSGTQPISTALAALEGQGAPQVR